MSQFSTIRRQIHEVLHVFTSQDVIVHPIVGDDLAIAAAVGPIVSETVTTSTGRSERRLREVKFLHGSSTDVLPGLNQPGWQGTIEIDGEFWAVDQVLGSDAVGHHLRVTDLQPQEDTGPKRYVRMGQRTR